MGLSLLVSFELLFALSWTVLSDPGFPMTEITEEDVQNIKKNP